MLIIDRYILRLFTKVGLISFASLTGLYIMIDTAGNFEEFVSYSGRLGGFFRVIGDYYGPRVFTFFDRISGLLPLIAAMFAVTWLQRTNELTALMAGGVSKLRVLAPLIIAAVVVSLLGVANRELLIPSVREKLTRNAQDWLGENPRPLTPRYDIATDILLGGKATIAAAKRIDHPNFRLPPSLRDFGRQLEADSAVYLEPQDSRPGGYLLEGMTNPSDIDDLPSATFNEQDLILTPHDTDWLQPNQCFVASRVSFDRLASGNAWQQFASLPELIAGLRNPSLDLGADTRVAIHTRFIQPLLDMTLLFLGLPLVLSRNNRHIFVAIGTCLGIVVLFVLVQLVFNWLGANYLISPALAAWCPLMIFLPVAFALSPPLFE